VEDHLRRAVVSGLAERRMKGGRGTHEGDDVARVAVLDGDDEDEVEDEAGDLCAREGFVARRRGEVRTWKKKL
jgi:hypothetical protein